MPHSTLDFVIDVEDCGVVELDHPIGWRPERASTFEPPPMGRYRATMMGYSGFESTEDLTGAWPILSVDDEVTRIWRAPQRQDEQTRIYMRPEPARVTQPLFALSPA